VPHHSEMLHILHAVKTTDGILLVRRETLDHLEIETDVRVNPQDVIIFKLPVVWLL